MFLRIFSIFLLVFITSACHSYAYKLSEEETKDLNVLWEQQKANFENNGGYIECGDWALEIKSENEDSINVNFSAWGMGWHSHERQIPKLFDQNDKKIYVGDIKEPYVFIKDKGKWRSLGHFCSDVSSYDALVYRCPNNKERVLDITGYSDNSLIIIHNKQCEYSIFNNCESVEDIKYFVLLRDENITDRDVFINGDLRIERTNNSWVIDEKLCE